MNNATMETVLATLFSATVFLLLLLFFPDQLAWAAHWLRHEISHLAGRYWG